MTAECPLLLISFFFFSIYLSVLSSGDARRWHQTPSTCLMSFEPVYDIFAVQGGLLKSTFPQGLPSVALEGGGVGNQPLICSPILLAVGFCGRTVSLELLWQSVCMAGQSNAGITSAPGAPCLGFAALLGLLCKVSQQGHL